MQATHVEYGLIRKMLAYRDAHRKLRLRRNVSGEIPMMR
jgi:hypothetical protein